MPVGADSDHVRPQQFHNPAAGSVVHDHAGDAPDSSDELDALILGETRGAFVGGREPVGVDGDGQPAKTGATFEETDVAVVEAIERSESKD